MAIWIIFLAVHTLASNVHDFHVSRVEVVYRTETRGLEITHHLFADDVEQAIRADTGAILHLSTELETDGAEEKFSTYLLRHIEISIDGNQVALDYLGKEPGEDNMAMWAYVEAMSVGMPESVTIRYDLLFEVFGDQKNIVSFQVDRERPQMYLLDRGTPEVTFSVE